MKFFIITFIIILSLVCVSSGIVSPLGYVGGYINSDGDTVGGHPSEEVMYNDRLMAGVIVTSSVNGCPIYTGVNWREFAAMNGRCYGEFKEMNYQISPKFQPVGYRSSGAGYTPVTILIYPDRIEYVLIKGDKI
jgi:hypothetical protein